MSAFDNSSNASSSPQTRLIRAFMTERNLISTGLTLHSVTTIGLGCRALRKLDSFSKVTVNPT